MKALVTADRFGPRTSSRTSRACATTLPDLEWVAVVGDARAPADPRDIRVRRPGRRRAARRDPAPVDPRAPALVAYTSGTTRDPKGVVHSHRTISAEIHQLVGDAEPTAAAPPPMITGAPVGHGIGMLAALLMPGVPAAARSTSSTCGIRAACCRRCSTTAARPARARRSSSRACSTIPTSTPSGTSPLMPFIGLGGSAVPAAVGERCASARHRDRRAASAATEHPSITGCTPDVAARQARQHRRRAAARRRDAPRRRRRQRRRGRRAGRDLEPRPRLLRRLHRPGR